MAGSNAIGLTDLGERLREGLVIPAHPLALTAARTLDERRQTALTRYYCDAGAGGLAVGVHTTQFAIRDPAVGLLRPVLDLAARTVRDWQRDDRRPVMVAGVVGPTSQALAEAELANALGYDAILVSLAALRDASNTQLVEHCRQLAAVLPVFGFYLQPAVGGRVLDRSFWRAFLDIERVVAIKVAPFDRYRTLDVVQAIAASGRRDVALYTGNDDAIVTDLVTPFPGPDVAAPPIHFAGGLLGQWAVWTRGAVDVLNRCRAARGAATGGSDPATLDLLGVGAALTDVNRALFDPAHGFAGCIPGIHEVLRRQGLLAGRWCLDPHEELSPGQMEEIDRVLARHQGLSDNQFVAEHLDRWLA